MIFVHFHRSDELNLSLWSEKSRQAYQIVLFWTIFIFLMSWSHVSDRWHLDKCRWLKSFKLVRWLTEFDECTESLSLTGCREAHKKVLSGDISGLRKRDRPSEQVKQMPWADRNQALLSWSNNVLDWHTIIGAKKGCARFRTLPLQNRRLSQQNLFLGFCSWNGCVTQSTVHVE
jgi:hypothetical protein